MRQEIGRSGTNNATADDYDISLLVSSHDGLLMEKCGVVGELAGFTSKANRQRSSKRSQSGDSSISLIFRFPTEKVNENLRIAFCLTICRSEGM
jgi:hypothetical protein